MTEIRPAPTRELLSYFDAAHRGLLGVPAVIAGGKDAKLIASLWKTQGDTMTRQLIDDFFASDDPWIKNNGYTVGRLVTEAGKLLARRIRRQPVIRGERWYEQCERLGHEPRCADHLAHGLRVAKDEQARRA